MRSLMSVIGTLCLWLLLSLLLRGAPPPAYAESASTAPSELEVLKDELVHVKTTLAGIKKELAQLRQMLSPRSAPPTRPPDAMATVGVAGNAMLGNPEAPLTLVEFSDYQCPFCARFHQSTLAALKAEYIDTGKLRYVFRDFPLDQLHPQARKAAEAARCAGEQGRYWEMHDLLFQQQKALEVEQLKAYGRDLGLDALPFEACIAQGRYAAAVQQDVEAGMAAGVRGTPGFFLGRTRPDDTIQGLAIKGAQPIAAFRQTIEHLMAEK